jgi:Flp pilus assembly protein TadG
MTPTRENGARKMSTPAVTLCRAERSGSRGQILAIGAILLVALIAMGALLLEGGNAFAQQRITQNGSDAAANAGAVVLAQRLGGTSKTDADVAAAVNSMISSNGLTAVVAQYTDVSGKTIDSGGTQAAISGNPPAAVGSGSIPPNAQGVAVSGTKTFATVLARALGINSFSATSDATAITGRAVGGPFLPVIFPVSISDCDQSGGLTPPFTQNMWDTSDPPVGNSPYPVGTEYIVPLCKTNSGGQGGGSFQILDLDPNLSCLQETQNPPYIEWTTFPVDVAVDNGNNCAKPIADEVNANLRLTPVMIPFCDNACTPSGQGSHAFYHVTGVAAFYIDYMSDSNNKNNSACLGGVSPNSGQPLTNIINGNGSSSCVVGWFIQLITSGPVGSGTIGNGEAIAVQLIR